ncbi:MULTISPECIES: OsmC family protein [unclassified Thioalkalivibrio]|uniref:OsmC family protein n=1 Tax=unclassified Thioalkalivibrio TaxID=2621013 RepID=UPI000368561F|nr:MULTISPECIES: OsmC family protein [unclassified Thioalkalivibrio]
MLEYQLNVERVDAHGSLAHAKQAEVTLDTDMDGRDDALSPPELLLASLGACMVRGIQRALPMLHMEVDSISIQLRGWRQDDPPAIAKIEYRVEVGTDADEEMVELLHRNVQKGTIYSTLAAGTQLTGEVVARQ